MFGKSFDEKVQAAITEMGSLHIKALDAKIDGKVVTLTGEAPDMAAKAKAMQIFNSMVESENTINLIRIAEPVAASRPAPAPAPTAAPTGAEEALPPTLRVHVVAQGET